MKLWELIKKFMRETEAANRIQFANSAWDRAKQLEADIQTYVSEIEAEYQGQLAAAAAQAREDADRVGAARIAFEEGQTQRVIALEKCVAAVVKVCEKARGSGQVGQILVADLVEDAIRKANGPG